MNLFALKRQLIFNNKFDTRIHFWLRFLTSTQKKVNTVNRTQVCNLKIWVKEKLSLPKARGVITENILLLKYQKQAITAALNVQYNQWNIKNNILMLLPTALRKLWIYQMLTFIVSRDISPIWNKVLDREFY